MKGCGKGREQDINYTTMVSPSGRPSTLYIPNPQRDALRGAGEIAMRLHALDCGVARLRGAGVRGTWSVLGFRLGRRRFRSRVRACCKPGVWHAAAEPLLCGAYAPVGPVDRRGLDIVPELARVTGVSRFERTGGGGSNVARPILPTRWRFRPRGSSSNLAGMAGLRPAIETNQCCKASFPKE